MASLPLHAIGIRTTFGDHSLSLSSLGAGNLEQTAFAIRITLPAAEPRNSWW
jgi:hypothetical protein